MITPLVSIIIPTFNREKELERALNSVFSQTYTNWEICIVDNNSSDNSIQLINNYNNPRIKLYTINNKGVIGASRNLGIQKAKGKYLAFLDSDDWWSSRKLEVSVKFLEQGKASVVYHDLFIVKKESQKFFFRRTKSRQLKKPMFDDLIINGNALLTSSVVLKREIMAQITGFTEDASLIAIEDYHTWLSLAIADEYFIKISEVLGYYWLGGNNINNPSRTIQTLNDLEKKFQEKIVELELSEKTYWLSYSKARAYCKLNMRTEALLEFYSSLAKNPIFKIKCKTIFMVIILRIQNYLTR